MTRIIVEIIIWDNWNRKYIKKHKVSIDEVERAGRNLRYHKHTYGGRYVFVGRSGKRILSVVIKRKQLKTYYVVTARDADKKERRRLYEKEKQNTKI